MLKLCLLALVCLVQTCLGGGLYSGVSSSTVEAHGPLARLAVESWGQQYYHHGLASSPLTIAARTHVPVATHSVAFGRATAPVDVDYHLPSDSVTTDAPVINFVDQPGYLRRLIDVSKAEVAVAKLQVRRPAIQKQFYDVEERTIIRPVGSAVVELEEPVSKKLVTPFTVTSNGYQRPLLYPVQYPLAPYGQCQTPDHQFYPLFIQQTPQQYPLHQGPQQYPTILQLPQQPTVSSPQAPSFPQPSLPSPDDSSSGSEFDSSDTVVVENPDFARARQTTEQPRKTNEKKVSFEEFEKSVNAEVPIAKNFQQDFEKDQIVKNILNDLESRHILIQGKTLPQQRQNFQILLKPPQLQQYQEQHKNLLNEDKPSGEEFHNTTSEAITSTHNNDNSKTTISTSGPDHAVTVSDIHSDPELRSSFNQQFLSNIAFNTLSNEHQFLSDTFLTQEELQDNQQKLLELLTGHGEVSEVVLSGTNVKSSPVGDSGVLRGRVVSVTTAPRSQERLTTRRLVVSRPVHTVEDVDVKKPFDKVERQRTIVNEPTILKTIHTIVPTAVPVYTRSFAPVFYH